MLNGLNAAVVVRRVLAVLGYGQLDLVLVAGHLGDVFDMKRRIADLELLAFGRQDPVGHDRRLLVRQKCHGNDTLQELHGARRFGRPAQIRLRLLDVTAVPAIVHASPGSAAHLLRTRHHGMSFVVKRRLELHLSDPENRQLRLSGDLESDLQKLIGLLGWLNGILG